MTKENTQAEVMSKVADIIEGADLSVAEKVGMLAILQTSYVMAATSK